MEGIERKIGKKISLSIFNYLSKIRWFHVLNDNSRKLHKTRTRAKRQPAKLKLILHKFPKLNIASSIKIIVNIFNHFLSLGTKYCQSNGLTILIQKICSLFVTLFKLTPFSLSNFPSS